MSSQCLLVCVTAVPRVLLQHVLQRRQVEVDLVGVVLVHQCKTNLVGPSDLPRERSELS